MFIFFFKLNIALGDNNFQANVLIKKTERDSDRQTGTYKINKT